MSKKRLFPFITVAFLMLQSFSPLMALLPVQARPTPRVVITSPKVDFLEGQKTDTSWTPGNICAGVGVCYSEGDNVPHRLGLKKLTVGTKYTVEIAHDYKCSNSIVGYSEFNSMVNNSGATIDDFTYLSGSSSSSEHVYKLDFTASAKSPVFQWNAKLGNDASDCNGSNLHVTLPVAKKTVPISVKDLVSVEPSTTPTVIPSTTLTPDVTGTVVPSPTPPVCEEGPTWAYKVERVDQGLNKSGGTIPANRSDAKDVLGIPDGKFFSPGVKGELIVMFKYPVLDVDGVDLSFHEVTNGRPSYPEEKLDVEVSKNGSDWFAIGTVTNKDGGDGVGYLDFNSTGLSFVNYVKVIDATDYSLHNDEADGYDLDAIDATYGVCEENPEKYGQIELCKFEDKDGNGQKGDREKLIKWDLHVKGLDDVRRSDNGCYLWEEVPAGKYNAYESEKKGWVNTTDNSRTEIRVREDRTTRVLFGNYELNEIEGYKFIDTNGNGEIDKNDMKAKDWRMKLYDSKWKFIDSEKTNKDGKYEFEKLTPGKYYVCEVMQDGFQQVLPDKKSGVMEESSDSDLGEYCHYIKVDESGKNYKNRNFLNQPYSSIVGVKFEDNNGNGKRDDNDKGLPKWEIVFKSESQKPVDEFTVDSSDPDGEMSSLSLDSSKQYLVEVEGTWMNGKKKAVDAEYFSTDGWSSYDDMMMIPGRDERQLDLVIENRNVNWGSGNDMHLYKTVLSNVSGNLNFRVFDEDNDNNPPKWYRDNKGKLNVRIYEVKDRTFTDREGNYSIDLPVGKYQVVEVNQKGWKQTAPNNPSFCHINLTPRGNESCDFGNFRLGDISGLKFEDIDGDGEFDDGERGSEGWTIKLWYGDREGPKEVVAETKTDSEGRYMFDNLMAGVYYLSEDQNRDGWMQTTEEVMGPYVLNSGASFPRVIFGNFELAEVNGFKIEDFNGDGKLDRSDKRLNEWKIYLWSGTEEKPIEIVDMTETAYNDEIGSDGYYEFEGLKPGIYWLSETDVSGEIRDGWMQTFPNDKVHGPIIVKSGAEYPGNNFGNFQLGLIDGWKIEDFNGDGTLEREEPRLNDWTIYLWEGTEETPKEIVRRTRTSYSDFYDSDGYYFFENLKPGIYWISESMKGEMPEGWVQTFPQEQDGFYGPIVVTSGVVSNGNNFGNFQLGEIQGQKYEDVNYNGDRDEFERQKEYKLKGWTISLYDENGSFLDSMETGDDSTEAGAVGKGQYRFVGLKPGKYYVCEEGRDGWQQTEPSKGYMMDDQYCHKVKIYKSGKFAKGRMFGNYELGMIDGYKWDDVNGDSKWNRDEKGIRGWVIELWEVVDKDEYELVKRVRTNRNGYYKFEYLEPGRYFVAEHHKDKWVQTFPTEERNHGPLGIKASGTVIGSINFGNNRPPDIEIMKTNYKVSSEAGETFTYDVRVTNIGLGKASKVRVIDTLPEYVSFISATEGGELYIPDNDRVVGWPKFNLKPGRSKLLQVTVKVDDTVPSGVEFLLNEVVAADNGRHGQDLDMRNNFDEDLDRLIARPDLIVEKTSEVELAVPGNEITYAVNVKNVGTQGVKDVMASDDLPEDTSFVSATKDGDYVEVDHQVNWPKFNLDAGETWTAEITVAVNDIIPFDLSSITNVLSAYQSCELLLGELVVDELQETSQIEEAEVAELVEEVKDDIEVDPSIFICEVDPTPEDNNTELEIDVDTDGNVEGITDERDPNESSSSDSESDGGVLGASDTLAETGQNVLVSILVVLSTVSILAFLNKDKLIWLFKNRK